MKKAPAATIRIATTTPAAVRRVRVSGIKLLPLGGFGGGGESLVLPYEGTAVTASAGFSLGICSSGKGYWFWFLFVVP